MQRLIYNVSVGAPLLFVMAIVWYLQQKTLGVPIALVLVSVVLAALLYASFRYASKNVESTTINIVELQSKDSWVVLYVISYLIPLASIVIDELEVLLVALALVLVVILSRANTPIPHPLLFAKGYHFYAVNGANGVAEYILISKNKGLRNVKHVVTVKRLFEYLLIEG